MVVPLPSRHIFWQFLQHFHLFVQYDPAKIAILVHYKRCLDVPCVKLHYMVLACKVVLFCLFHESQLSPKADAVLCFRHISRWDIQVALRCGCPSIDRKVVNSGKRLRAYVGLDEGEVITWNYLLKSSLEAQHFPFHITSKSTSHFTYSWNSHFRSNFAPMLKFISRLRTTFSSFGSIASLVRHSMPCCQTSQQ